MIQRCKDDSTCPNKDPCLLHSASPSNFFGLDALTQQNVQVPLSMGQVASLQPTGSFQQQTVAKPPTHKQIQKEATGFGKSVRQKLRKQPKKERRKSIKKMSDLAEQVEQEAIESGVLTKASVKRAKKKLGPGFKGKDFRALQKGLDETTQSQTTAALNRGLTQASDDEGSSSEEELNEFALNTARVQNAQRLPTRDVVAPVTVHSKVKGKKTKTVMGQQHPTERSQPKVLSGRRGHAQGDRNRASTQIETGSQLLKKTKDPVTSMIGSMISANSSTLSRMSLPLSASNVSASMFTPQQRQDQTQSRMRLKKQQNLLASSIGLPTAKKKQSMTAPKKSWNYPASPPRELSNSEDSSSEEEQTQHRKRTRTRKRKPLRRDSSSSDSSSTDSSSEEEQTQRTKRSRSRSKIKRKPPLRDSSSSSRKSALSPRRNRIPRRKKKTKTTTSRGRTLRRQPAPARQVKRKAQKSPPKKKQPQRKRQKR